MTPLSTGNPRPLRAAGWMTIAQLLFAVMGAGARIGSRDIPWQEVGAARFVLGALTAYVAARSMGKSLRITHARVAWLRSAFGTLSAAGTFFLYATPTLPIGDAATLLATAPVFVLLLSAPVLGEPIRRREASALAVGFAGLALVAQPSFSAPGHTIFVAIGTSMASAFAFLSLRRIGPTETSEAIVFHFACVGSGFMLLASVGVWKSPSAADAAALAVTGLCGGLAQLAMTRAYTLAAAARVSTLGYSGVVFARVLAFPVFGEVPSVKQVLGSLLVVGSGVLLATAKSTAATDVGAVAPPRSE